MATMTHVTWHVCATDVMDVALSQSMRRVYLVDFGPFGPSTEPLLFDWSELVAGMVSAATCKRNATATPDAMSHSLSSCFD